MARGRGKWPAGKVDKAFVEWCTEDDGKPRDCALGGECNDSLTCNVQCAIYAFGTTDWAPGSGQSQASALLWTIRFRIN